MESIFATGPLTASTVNSFYSFFTKLTSRAEHTFHINETELMASVVGVLVVLLILVILWKRRVDRYDEAVWRAGQYTANDPYKDAGMLKPPLPKDPWLVADPIGGPAVGEAMKVASLTEFMEKQAQAEQSSAGKFPTESSPSQVLRPSQERPPAKPLPTTGGNAAALSAPAAHTAPAAHVGSNGQSAELPPAGWYPDPSGIQAMLRYWDGNRWTASISRATSNTQASE
ncbi:MAG: DUF2510 domain-containing protein [Acidimicrobiales bacterium]